MDIKDVLTLDCTKSAVLCSSKKRVLELISELAAKELSEEPKELFECLLNREKMGTTGIGGGIAIPHGRIYNSDRAVGVFVQCAEPVKFDAVDNQPVDLLFALFVPDDLCKVHLATLSLLAKKFSDKALTRQLRCASSDLELYRIITQ
ncbi:PTS IIA-like nitrogen regulatory protein PtsN [Veronia pacifica]|uniref:PTS IIA-like nitrogen-regulatory protein PtsN n=1 Tax=Veronia pacifica TaxID=1080227 RepID=A0A1C3ELK8_9GAMM|nr:PTS IIA-like nitrogen regulatory protein PtsN [Veronia pacifica]ODA34127.1 PTS IIA-like nitrogen-regulatory protein PtsN [Veronia pacifica]